MSAGKPFDFDPSALRLGQDFAASVGVRKELTTIPVRRPDRQWFIQVHPDPAMRIETAVLETSEDRETFLIAPDLRAELPGEVVAKVLLTAITRQGNVFLWPIRLPDPLGKLDQWNQSAAAAAKLAEARWVRVVANRSLGAYETYVATGDLPPPEWPDKSLQDLLQLAFKDRYIDSMDHIVIRQLRGVT
jgi:hypothetical protein